MKRSVKIKWLILFMGVINIQLLFAQDKYIKVIGKESGTPLDSSEVSFYKVTGADFIYTGQTLISDKQGLVKVPRSIANDTNNSYKVNVNQLKEVRPYQHRFYGPTVKNINRFIIDTTFIEAELWLACPPIIHYVYFAPNSAKLLDFYNDVMNEILKVLLENPSYELRIIGHADSHAEHNIAEKISDQRAEVLREWFINNNIKRERIGIIAEGDAVPIAICRDGEDCAETDARNRRGEFKIIPPEEKKDQILYERSISK